MMKHLVTGAAGFIGFHTCTSLLRRGDEVVGVDNLNDYYDPALKKDRLALLGKNPNFTFYRGDVADMEFLAAVFKEEKPDKLCHLAAQAGVRYSLQNPFVYERSNLLGFLNILECCRAHDIKNLVYASSSSVYGANRKVPFSVEDRVDRPVSLYAATKRANELMAYTYHHLYGLKSTGLRFFTVYGPWGRPDMALFKFTRAIIRGEEIEVYNFGKMKRDFTYIDDITQGILAALDRDFELEIFNLGNSTPVDLDYFIACLENTLGRKARKTYLPMQAGDVEATWADISLAREKLGFAPRTPVEEGIKRFVDWFLEYYRLR